MYIEVIKPRLKDSTDHILLLVGIVMFLSVISLRDFTPYVRGQAVWVYDFLWTNDLAKWKSSQQ